MLDVVTWIGVCGQLVQLDGYEVVYAMVVVSVVVGVVVVIVVVKDDVLVVVTDV